MMQIATPDDYQGTDDARVRAAIAGNPCVWFPRQYILSDPTPIQVRSGLSLLGPGKQTGFGIKQTAGGGALFAGGSPTIEVAGFRIVGLDLYGANDPTHPSDRMFDGCTVKQSSMENCLVYAFTGDAWFVTGTDSNDNFTRDNRIVGTRNASTSSCGIYYDVGNAMYSQGDYVSFYPTLIRSGVTGFDVRNARLEVANDGGDAVYIDGGSANIADGWFDSNTIGRTVVQAAPVPVWASRNRGVYASNVHVADSSKFWPVFDPS